MAALPALGSPEAGGIRIASIYILNIEGIGRLQPPPRLGEFHALATKVRDDKQSTEADARLYWAGNRYLRNKAATGLSHPLEDQIGIPWSGIRQVFMLTDHLDPPVVAMLLREPDDATARLIEKKLLERKFTVTETNELRMFGVGGESLDLMQRPSNKLDPFSWMGGIGPERVAVLGKTLVGTRPGQKLHDVARAARGQAPSLKESALRGALNAAAHLERRYGSLIQAYVYVTKKSDAGGAMIIADYQGTPETTVCRLFSAYDRIQAKTLSEESLEISDRIEPKLFENQHPVTAKDVATDMHVGGRCVVAKNGLDDPGFNVYWNALVETHENM